MVKEVEVGGGVNRHFAVTLTKASNIRPLKVDIVHYIIALNMQTKRAE